MAINARSVLVTGANRGLGLEFVRQLIASPQPPEHVIATCRDPDKCTELREMSSANKSLQILKLDMMQNEKFASFAEQVSGIVGEKGLTMLINNAGIISRVNTLETLTKEELIKHFDVNAIAPVLLAQALLPLVRKAAAANPGTNLNCNRAGIFNVTSLMASIADNGSGGRYEYRSSKCALNMLTFTMHRELSQEGILVGLLHPGWVQTDMGGPNAKITAKESVGGMLNVIANMDEKNAGLMMNYAGNVLPW